MEHLSAERFGSTVSLHWTTPSRSTDGLLLAGGRHSAGVLNAEICRDTPALNTLTPSPNASPTLQALPASPPPYTCTPLTRLPVRSGEPAAFQDVLPPPFTTGKPRPLRYRVRVVNGSGKGAVYTQVITAAGDAPQPLQDLHAAMTSAGVLLRWRTGSTADRVLLQVTREGAAPTRKPAERQGGTAARASVETDTLSAGEAGGAATDTGGVLDHGAHPGVAERYTVYRTREIRLGTLTLTVNGEAATVAVAADARPAPPQPPIGLEAIASTLGQPEIDLLWQASSEPGVTGYVVFRSEVHGDAEGAATRLTAEPVPSFSYADRTARPGVTYRYRIACVDAAGQAGPQGPPVTESLPAQ